MNVAAKLVVLGSLVVSYAAFADPGPSSTPTAAAVDSKPAVKKGRVVRVARSLSAQRSKPLFCQLGGDEQGQCYVTAPAVGSEGYVLRRDGSGVAGKFVVSEISSDQNCGASGQWTFQYRMIDGSADAGGDWAVFGTGIDPTRGQYLPTDSVSLPKASGGETPWLVLDLDGNGSADIMSSVFACDRGITSSRYGATYCFEYWQTDSRQTWSLQREDVYVPC